MFFPEEYLCILVLCGPMHSGGIGWELCQVGKHLGFNPITEIHQEQLNTVL